MPTLERAFPFAEVDDVAEGVAKDLDFDVSGFDDEFFEEDAVVTKGVFGLGAARREAFVGFVVVVGNAQAFAAAPGGRLDHHRIADRARNRDGLVGRFDRVVVAGNRVHAGFAGQLFGSDFVAHRGDRACFRADEHDPFGLNTARELLVFGKKAVPRMNRLRAGGLTRGDDLVLRQVRLARRGRADAHRLVGEQHVAQRPCQPPSRPRRSRRPCGGPF